ncbi:MAG: flippase-like domain-containing protein [Planctomycetes bacterium]|nr:flippase-like domain-containing protein [Planctomycetota bacterium]
MNSNQSTPKKWLPRTAKLLIVLLLLGCVHHTLTEAWDQLGQYAWTVHAGWLVVAGGLYLLGLLPSGLFWHHILRTLGQHARRGEALRAYYIGHLGKYVPGKAMVVVLRAGLVRSERVNAGVAAVSVFLETLTMMSVGAFLAAAIIAARYRDQTVLFAVAVGLMILAGLPTLPPVFRRLVRFAGIGKSDPETAHRIARLGYSTLAVGWFANCIGWTLLATSLWAVLQAMDIAQAELLQHLARYTAAVSLAMVAGFLSLIPGGAVVRELVLTQLMVPFFRVVSGPGTAEAAAVVSAVLLRLVWLVAELILSAILYIGGARRGGPPGSSHPGRES